MLRPAAALAAALLFSTQALAGEAFLGVYKHAVDWGISGGDEEQGEDIELGYRSDRIEALGLLGRPSVYVFANGNLNGKTNFASAGFSWRHRWGPGHHWYTQAGVGVAVQDGLVDYPYANLPGLTPEQVQTRLFEQHHRIAFGSRVLAQPELDLGYQLNRRWTLEASYVHISNAGLGSRNPGMDNAGLRLVYRFGRMAQD